MFGYNFSETGIKFEIFFFFLQYSACGTDRVRVEGRDADVTLLSTVAQIVCMPANREGECAGHYLFLIFHRSIFTDWVGVYKRLPAALVLSCGILSMHASGTRRRACGTFCFALSAVQYFLSGEWGVELSTTFYLRQQLLWYACQRVGKVSGRDVFSLPFHHLVFTDWVGVGIRGVGISLLSSVALMVCMAVDREGECAGHCFLLICRRSIFMDWVGGVKGLLAAILFSCGILSMHASGSGRRVRGTFCFAPSAIQYFLRGG